MGSLLAATVACETNVKRGWIWVTVWQCDSDSAATHWDRSQFGVFSLWKHQNYMLRFVASRQDAKSSSIKEGLSLKKFHLEAEWPQPDEATPLLFRPQNSITDNDDDLVVSTNSFSCLLAQSNEHIAELIGPLILCSRSKLNSHIVKSQLYCLFPPELTPTTVVSSLCVHPLTATKFVFLYPNFIRWVQI